jgi:hypothetical protein
LSEERAMSEEIVVSENKPKKKTNIGVQSNKNRERDFEEGNPLAFIIGGFVFTALFIATIATIVGFVLSTNG